MGREERERERGRRREVESKRLRFEEVDTGLAWLSLSWLVLPMIP